MGKINIPPAAKLIIGLIYRNSAVKDKILDILKKRFGEVDFLSHELDFNYTDYYYPELGKPLKRLLVSFKQLASEDKLSDIKLYTNKIEERFSRKQKRQINIDPGFLSLGKIILATTKNYSHRVYLGKGIFAEATLFYKGAAFKPWPWAYPDYQSKEYISVFNAIRKLYQEQVRNVS